MAEGVLAVSHRHTSTCTAAVASASSLWAIILFPSANFTRFSAYVSVGSEKTFNEGFEGDGKI